MFPFADYTRHDGLGLAALVRSGAVSAAELLETALARIETHNPALNAVIRRRDELVRAEAAHINPQTAFAGVPFLVKDLIATLAGEPTANGNRLLTNVPAPRDSELVRRFRAAGVLIAGRTNTPEFGLTPYTEPGLFEPTRNPWCRHQCDCGCRGRVKPALGRRLGPGRRDRAGHGGQGPPCRQTLTARPLRSASATR